MKRCALVCSILLAVTLLASPTRADVRSNPHLERPKGWRLEETAYPPPWAQELPWKGALEIRFPPGWFDKDSPFYWSYPVLYWLEGDILSRRDELERALLAYDAGLYRGAFDRAKVKIDVGKDKAVEKLGHGVVQRTVTIEGFDPFVTKAPLTTYLTTFRWYCSQSQHTAVLILRSPKPFAESDRVWSTLLPFWEKFACHDVPKDKAKGTSTLPPLNEKVAAYARANAGQKVGDGICITLAVMALKQAGARAFPLDRADGDYAWGRLIERHQDALPGDILQFRDAVFDGRRVTKRRTVWWHEEYPHHTAIVSGVSEGGNVLTVLHQNIGGKEKSEADKKVVQETSLRMDSLQNGGWVRVYRPIAPE
ncbi:MAG: hypothetical protein P4L84_33510 [Isosphaeraceae bacterium]|nr:hypothetical protein [Isosphaeraceae bacterium]